MTATKTDSRTYAKCESDTIATTKNIPRNIAKRFGRSSTGFGSKAKTRKTNRAVMYKGERCSKRKALKTKSTSKNHPIHT
jgi:hypothetical protein